MNTAKEHTELRLISKIQNIYKINYYPCGNNKFPVMRKVFFVLALFIGIGFVNAQKVKLSDVPASVQAKFKSLHPAISWPKWEKEDGNFEAHYKEVAKKMTCVIDPSGKYVQTELAINASGLPKVVTTYLAKNMPGKKVSEAAKITGADGKITYEAEVKDVDYTFDAQGNFIKKEVDND